MPVTARLSRKFYATFGEDVTNELVDWFNSVDATYRSDLRELNELNFGRFDAKLEQRLAELDAKWAGQWTRLDAKLEQRLAEFDARWMVRWNQMDSRLSGMGDLLRKEIADTKSELLKWMFAFWAPTALAVGALLLRK